MVLVRKQERPALVFRTALVFLVFKLTGPLELLQFEQGQSNPTYYVRLANHQLVLRRKSPATLVPSTHALEREFR